eukprot:TRINITY_DN44856_c0_g1_i1.p1 TRINITY_DN44856_c0_g1~~TRINITY_DN44856_c0_g1_i1.p1  ORF type:complete len:983 (+),score=155.35 TRINITY_DN44856_c0_g1_i1:117-2951(+)
MAVSPSGAQSRTSIKPSGKVTMLQELGEDLAATPFAVTLGKDPCAREPERLEEALDWWLRSLPAAGVRLAPELQSPRKTLLQVFARGRLAVCAPGQRLQEEGDDIRHYTIVLLGKCRLRCKAPPPAVGGAPRPMSPELEGGEDAATTATAAVTFAGVDAEGLVTCNTVRAGDSFGQPPGEQRSIYDIVVVEHSMLLLLTVEDYAATLRPFQRELQTRTVEYLQQHRICPQGTSSALQRLSVMLRLRQMRRGSIIMRSGRPLRHVWFLREGCVSILTPEEGAASLAVDEGSEDEELRQASDEERDERDRLERMRVMCRSAREQQAAAAEEERRNIVRQYARGKLAQSLAQGSRPKSPVPGGSGPRASALSRKPGTTFGEEVLLNDSFRDMLSTCYYYTARASEDSLFYVADVAAFRHLAMCTGADSVPKMIEEKLNRRVDQVLRNDRVSRRIARQGRNIQKHEMSRWDRPQIRLPRSTGYEGPSDVEDVNEWLQVTFEHRKAPLNEMNPPSLSCLEVLGSKGRAMVVGSSTCGPGVSSLLRNFSDEAAIRKHRREGPGSIGLPRRSGIPASTNPMGAQVASSARYTEVFPSDVPSPADTSGGSDLLWPENSAVVSATAISSIFLQTEPPEAELTPPHLDSRVLVVASGSQSPPREPEIELTPPLGALPPARQTLRSTSVPTLPPLEDTASPSRGAGGSRSGVGDVNSFSFNLEDDGQDEMHDDDEMPSIIPLELTRRLQASQSATTLRSQGARQRRGGCTRSVAKVATAERKRYVVKQFTRAVEGKSVLVLTDKADVRKAICGTLMETQTALVFLKSTSELWQRFRSEKDHFHALILDLTKFELQVESVLRTIRQNDKYSLIPIVVLATERELSEIVRVNCSFVVFKPVVASMLREALLWCFDKRIVQDFYKKESLSDDSMVTAGKSPQSVGRNNQQMVVTAGGM